MSIRPLPREEVRRIRSSVVITSLNQAVIGLLKNSLDAGATRVSVTVDYSRGNITVEDDGHGIPQHEFSEAGGLGQVHYTSRHPPKADIHGSRGEFIASLAALSLVSITSRHESQLTGSSLSIRNTTVLSRHLQYSPENALNSFSHGTQVSVWDLFGSMGVRVKQRPAAGNKHVLDKEFFRLVQLIVAVLLAWPLNVTVRMTEGVGDQEIYIRPCSQRDGTSTKASSRVPRILVHSGLADTASFGTWLSVGGSAGDISVSGCISLNAVATRRAQFISFGIHPLGNDRGSNILYEEVNRVFAHSDFAMVEVQETSRSNEVTVTREVHRKRGLERWPMFYLRIEPLWDAPHASDPIDALLEQSRILSQVAHLLRAICFEFLKKHHFHPHQVESISPETNQNPLSSQADSSNVDMSVADEAEKASSRPSGASGSDSPSIRASLTDSVWHRFKVGKSGPLARPASAPVPSRLASCSEARVSPQAIINDPLDSTKERQMPLVNKTGFLSRQPFADIEATSQVGLDPNFVGEEPSGPSVHMSTNRSGETSNDDRGEPSVWLQRMLDTWHNPVFPPAEEQVPRLEESMAITEPSNSHACYDHDRFSFDMSRVRQQAKLSKGALQNAQVISQVDEKFILIKIQPESNNAQPTEEGQGDPLLVIVDQHAADERYRLESLMKDYFVSDEAVSRPRARTESLENALRFEFSRQEAEMLRRLASHFQHWGIFYRFEPQAQQAGPSDGGLVAEITSLPPSILERGRSEPRLLADLLRDEIWKIAESDKGLLSASSQQVTRRMAADQREANDWVSLFHGCPQGILDMLNSRSCRSAIMFNDVLNLEECEDLLRRLSQCAFPFQCAHGRPSMVPLVDLNSFKTTFKEYS